MNADIIACQPHNMKTRIIGKLKLPYRAAAKFTFLKENERSLLRQFLKTIEIEVENTSNDTAASDQEEENIEEFNELDDL